MHRLYKLHYNHHQVHMLISHAMQFSKSWSKLNSLLTITWNVLKNKDWFTTCEHRSPVQVRLTTMSERAPAALWHVCQGASLAVLPFLSCTSACAPSDPLSVQVMDTTEDLPHLPCLFYFYPNQSHLHAFQLLTVLWLKTIS